MILRIDGKTNFNSKKPSFYKKTASDTCASNGQETKSTDSAVLCEALKALNKINFKGKPERTVTDLTVNGKRTITTEEKQGSTTTKTIEQLDNNNRVKSKQIITTEIVENGKTETIERIIGNRTVSKISTQEIQKDGVKIKIKITKTPKNTTIETIKEKNATQIITKEKYGKNDEFLEKTITKKHTNDTYSEDIESFDKNGVSLGTTKKSLIQDDSAPHILIEEFDSNGNLISSKFDNEFSKKYEKSEMQIVKNVFLETKNLSPKELENWAEEKLCEFFDTKKPENITIQDWAQSLLDDNDYQNWKSNIKEPSIVLPCAARSKLAQKINILSDTSNACSLKAPVRDIATKNKTKILSVWFENILSDIANSKNTTALNYTILSQIADLMDSSTAHLPKKYDRNALVQTIKNIKLKKALNESVNKNIIGIYKDFVVKKALLKLADENFDKENMTGWIVLTKKDINELAVLSHDTWCTSSTCSNTYLNSGNFMIYYENAKPALGVKFKTLSNDENNKVDCISEIQGLSNDQTLPFEKFPVIRNLLESKGINLNNLYEENLSDKLALYIRPQIQSASLRYHLENGLLDSNSTQKDLFKILGIDEKNLEKTEDNLTIIPDNYITNDIANLLRETNLFYTFAENSKINGFEYRVTKSSDDSKEVIIKGKNNITIQKRLDKNNLCKSTVFKDSATKEILYSFLIDGKTYVVSNEKVYGIENDNITDESYKNEPLYDDGGNFAGIKRKSRSGRYGKDFEYLYGAYDFFDSSGKLLFKKEILKSDKKTIEITKNTKNEYVCVEITDNLTQRTTKYRVVDTIQTKNNRTDIVIENSNGEKYLYNINDAEIKKI